MNANPKALKLAAGILKEFSSDGEKTVAMALIAPAVLLAMRAVPPNTLPSIENLQAVLRDAAAALEKAANAGSN